jgi:hypothetical protein
MKPFKNKLIGKLIIGIGDAFTGGTISNIVYKDENTEAGEIDFRKAGISIGTIILIWAYVTGKITIDSLTHIIGVIN